MKNLGKRPDGRIDYLQEYQVWDLTATPPKVLWYAHFHYSKPAPAFAEFALHCDFAGPIERKQAAPHVAVKRGVRPFPHAGDQAMLDRIDGAICDVTLVIGIVADQVLPEPLLRDAAFAARGGPRARRSAVPDPATPS